MNNITNIISEVVKVEEVNGKTIFKLNIENTINYDKEVKNNDEVRLALLKCIKLIKNLPEYTKYKDELQTLAATI